MFLGDADFESAKKSDLKKFKMNRSSEKDKIIEAQAELIENLQKQIKEWEEWKASSKDRHAKGREKAKKPKAKKPKVGFLRKHKPKK